MMEKLPALTDEERFVADALAIVESGTVETPEQYAACTDAVKTLQQARKRVEAERRSWVDPLNQQVQRINEHFRPFRDKCDQAMKEIKRLMAEYAEEQLRKERLAAMERARAEKEQAEALADFLLEAAGDPDAAEAVLDLAERTTPEQAKVPVAHGSVGSAHVRETWTFTVEDPDQVPREYLVVDERKIREAVQRGIREIPGVRIEKKLVPVVR